MNYGMVALYLFFVVDLVIAAWTCAQERYGRQMFLGCVTNVVVILTLLAWSHGWRIAWMP